MRVFAAIALLIASASLWAQSVPETRELVAQSSRALGVPAFSYGENSQCDGDGDLFFHATANLNESKILELSADGVSTFYTLPAEEAQDNYFVAFRVSPSGKVRILTHARSDELTLYEFAQSGSGATKTPMEIPKGLDPRNFAVLPNGHIVIQGYLGADAAEEDRFKDYLGEFDASGTAVRKRLDKADAADIEAALKQVTDAAAAESDDGRIYLLDGNAVEVLDPSGEVSARFKLATPGEGFHAGDVYASGAFLLIKYRKILKGTIKAEYGLLDRASGKTIRFYVPSDELGNNLVCFSSDGFTFLRYEHGRVKLLTAKP